MEGGGGCGEMILILYIPMARILGKRRKAKNSYLLLSLYTLSSITKRDHRKTLRFGHLIT
jgi:hypothetical protein